MRLQITRFDSLGGKFISYCNPSFPLRDRVVRESEHAERETLRCPEGKVRAGIYLQIIDQRGKTVSGRGKSFGEVRIRVLETGGSLTEVKECFH